MVGCISVVVWLGASLEERLAHLCGGVVGRTTRSSVHTVGNVTIDFQQLFCQVEKKITEFRSEGMRLDSQRREIMNNLASATKEAAAKCGENEKLLDTTNKILDQLRRGAEWFWDGIAFNFLGTIHDWLSNQL